MGMAGIKNDENIINENNSIDSETKNINIYLNQVCKSICKIIIQLENNQIIGVGFLIKLCQKEKPFFCLMTNGHLINKEIIESNETIEIYYDFGNIKNKINLDKNERFIKEYNYLNITIIEIIEEDNINEDYYLLPYLDYNNLEDKKIYIPQYPEGNNIINSEGEIIKIDKYKIIHNVNTKKDSSGSPIFLKNTNKVIGINKQRKKNEKYGILIYPIINILNGVIIYNKDQYEGEYANDKFEGKGKYIYETGNYYIGEWKNGLRNGKGILYYKNGNIKYEGDWINDKFKGNGK